MNEKTILFEEDSRDGEALDDLPGNGNALPVVMLLEQDLINPRQIGANNFVRRPVDCEQFSEAVRPRGLYWRLLNESLPHRGVR
jgi:hypothetical protein